MTRERLSLKHTESSKPKQDTHGSSHIFNSLTVHVGPCPSSHHATARLFPWQGEVDPSQSSFSLGSARSHMKYGRLPTGTEECPPERETSPASSTHQQGWSCPPAWRGVQETESGLQAPLKGAARWTVHGGLGQLFWFAVAPAKDGALPGHSRIVHRHLDAWPRKAGKVWV
jgi:hypothetical protein